MSNKYNHKKNAGNKADVWKHRVLSTLVNLLKPKTYFESHCGYPFYNKGKMQFSSYMKVKMQQNCSMVLCDTDIDIRNHIPSGMDIEFIHGDGWLCLYDHPYSDLCFIDPPYETMDDIIKLENVLNDIHFLHKPLVAWYPIFEFTNTDNFNFNSLPRIECEITEGKLIGCGMVFKNIPEPIMVKVNETINSIDNNLLQAR